MHFDSELESCILGTLALHPEMIDVVEVEEDDFTIPQNKTIYSALMRMSQANRPISLYTLGLELRKYKVRVEELYVYWQSLELSSEDYLKECTTKLKELTVLREVELALSKSINASDVIDRVEELQSKLSSEDILDLDRIMQEYDAERQEKIDNGNMIGLTTGFNKLDIEAPLEKGTLTILAARPSVGKSSFALSMARNVAEYGGRVLFISIEMSVLRLMDRLVSIVADVPLSKVRTGEISNESISAVRTNIAALKDYLSMVFIPNATSSQVTRLITREHRKRPIDLVIVDYLQLMCDPMGKNMTDDIRIGRMTRALKVLSGKLNNSVLLLSQVNRQAASEDDGMPRLHQLRGSGNIEQDSDVVLILNRRKKDDSYGELMIAKNRNGASELTIPVTFNLRTTEYKERITTQEQMVQDVFYG